jgi:hypothetical protein
MTMGSGDELTVLDPRGYPPRHHGAQLARRLQRLEGELVYVVDCRFEAADRLLEQVCRWFSEYLPAVRTKLVHWRGHGFDPDPQTLAEVAANGSAAILGVGI